MICIGTHVVHVASVNQEYLLCKIRNGSIKHTFAGCHFTGHKCQTGKDIMALALKKKKRSTFWVNRSRLLALTPNASWRQKVLCCH